MRQSKQLDYILTNMDSEDAHIPATFRFPSDHLPLCTSLTWPANLRLPRPIKYKRVVALDKDLSDDEVTRILEDRRWPDEPFIKVAAKLGLTKVHHIPQAPGKRFNHLVNDADLREQLQLLAQPNAKNELFVRLLQKNAAACNMIADRVSDLKNRCVLNRSDATQEVAMAQLTEQLSGISLEPLPEPDPVIEPNARLIKAFQDLPQTMRNNFSTQFHRDLPKEFFNVVSSMAYMKRKGHIAKEFRASAEHPEPPTFAKYFHDLCNRDHQQVLYQPRSENQTSYPPITEAEVDWALSSIGKKATGLDCLGYSILKKESLRETLVKKLAPVFNRWWRRARVPAYLKNARLIPLSKEDTDTPEVPNVRGISVMCTLLKTYEKIVHSRLTEQVNRNKLIGEH